MLCGLFYFLIPLGKIIVTGAGSYFRAKQALESEKL